MGQTKYIQRGETLDYVNTATGRIQAGDIVSMVSRIGIAGTDIGPGETGSVHVTGVFSVAKTTDAAVPIGTVLYYDGTGITDKGDGGASIPAGYAAANAAAGDAQAIVKLMG